MRQYKEDCVVTSIVTFGAIPLKERPMVPWAPPVTAQVTFVNDRRRRDADNHMAMLKPLWDAMVDVGLLEDDSKDHLRILDPKWEVGEPKVIVTLHGEGG